MIPSAIVLVFAVIFLAYTNGSNDNFKGVATLFGSDTTDYKRALQWATLTTLAGAISSVFLAGALVESFSGKGLVPDAVAGSPSFLQAVVLGAGLCVWVASITGFPISTTHSLTGALVGAGFMAAGTDVNLSRLGGAFFLPLIASPFLAFALSGVLYTVLRRLRRATGVQKELCICVGERLIPVATVGAGTALASAQVLDLRVDENAECRERYAGNVLGVSLQAVLNAAHYLSAGVVSFARGLNDTPKIMAALVGARAMGLHGGMFLVAVAMAVGGIQARKVAETMSRKITPLNHGQGLTANLVTGFLVLFASRFGVPVSTTHVSVGSLMGIGTVTGQANRGVIGGIAAAWFLTLPIAAALAAAAYWALNTFGA